MPSASEIIAKLGLQPLPGEGGYFRQTWMAPGEGRPQGTAILYLVTPDSFSALHRLDEDELFHFYLGDACQQVVIDHAGNVTTTILGAQVLGEQAIQTVVPAGCWQGTRLVQGGAWALLGTTMAPGYHHSGFELATMDDVRGFSIEVAAVAPDYLADGA